MRTLQVMIRFCFVPLNRVQHRHDPFIYTLTKSDLSACLPGPMRPQKRRIGIQHKYVSSTEGCQNS